jgi:hypothetical protein
MSLSPKKRLDKAAMERFTETPETKRTLFKLFTRLGAVGVKHVVVDNFLKKFGKFWLYLSARRFPGR